MQNISIINCTKKCIFMGNKWARLCKYWTTDYDDGQIMEIYYLHGQIHQSTCPGWYRRIWSAKTITSVCAWQVAGIKATGRLANRDIIPPREYRTGLLSAPLARLIRISNLIRELVFSRNHIFHESVMERESLMHRDWPSWYTMLGQRPRHWTHISCVWIFVSSRICNEV